MNRRLQSIVHDYISQDKFLKNEGTYQISLFSLNMQQRQEPIKLDIF